MNIDDLNNPSVSEMTEEELLERLNDIRSNRRKQSESSKKKQTSSKTNKPSTKKKDAKTKLLENMTAEERQKLLKELGDENGSS